MSRWHRYTLLQTASVHAVFVFGLGIMLLASCRSLPVASLTDFIGETDVQNTNVVAPDQKPVLTDHSSTKRRQSVTTEFYAAELVRESVVIDNKPGFRLTLRGGATIIHDDTVLKAPTIYLDPGNEGRLVGGVTVINREQGVTLRAESGSYSRANEFVKIEGLPQIEISRSGDKPVFATTSLIRRDMAEKKSYLDGDIRMHGEKWSLLADQAILSDDTGIMVFEKQPIVIGRDIYLSGGDIQYLTREKKIVLTDRPFARLMMIEKGKSPSPLKPETQAYLKGLPSNTDPKTLPPEIQEELRKAAEKVQAQKDEADSQRKNDSQQGRVTADDESERRVEYNLSAGQIEYIFGDTTQAILKDQVLITSEVRILSGDEFRMSGQGLSIIEADRGVKMIDNKEKMEITARKMRYDTKKKWLWLSGSPVVELYEKQSIATVPVLRARLEAAVIERDMDNEVTLARGSVHLKRKQEEAIAEIAELNEKDQTMNLLGRPFLLRGSLWVRCKKIQMLSNPDRIVFEEDVSGGIR